VAICTASGNQDGYQITPDGAGGGIIFWRDERGANADIYAQRVNTSGVVQWTTDGVAVCTAANDQEDLCVEADGAGGAVACWVDYRAGRNTYAQRIDQTGAALWAANGVSCGGYSMQYDPRIIPDGTGGAIVTWRYGIGSDADVLAQRIDAAGARQWGADALAVCAETGYQGNPQIASDDAGGAIITWVDSRGGYPDIYAQRVDGFGAVQWAAGGIAVCTPGTERVNPGIVPDGAGGAIIAWEENYGSYEDVYAQRVDAAGILMWPADGAPIATGGYAKSDPSIISDGAEGAVVIWWQSTAVCGQRVNAAGDILWIEIWGITICTGAPNQIFPAIVSDDAGGAIVAWADYRSGFTKVYTQRIDAASVLQWPSEGVQLCAVNSDQYPPEICSDGAGGAIVMWFDKRDQSDDVYVQRVDASGVVQWGADAVAVCTAWGDQYNGEIVSDGVGGAIMTWMDIRSDFYGDIYAQRVDATGAVQWTTDGIAVCAASGEQVSPQVASDGAGGAIITWEDNRTGTYYYDIYAQRVDASGAVQWAADGIAVCTAAGVQTELRIVSDGAGGAIITWMDDRNGNDDIYAQRIDADGAVQWIADGLPIRIASNDQSPPEIVSDGNGGAVIVWSEYLIKDSAEDRDLYAQRISAMGALHWAEDGVPLCTTVGFQ
jgi:predicted lipoprotein with Yx(FWY)xxD motif